MFPSAFSAAHLSAQNASQLQLDADLSKIQPHLERAISKGRRSLEVAPSAYKDPQRTRDFLVGQGYRVTTTHGGYGWLIEW